MVTKRTAATRKAKRDIRSLSAKTLTAKQARGVKGGLILHSANGKHIKEAILTVR